MPDEQHSGWCAVSRDFFLSLKWWLDSLSSAHTWQILVVGMIVIAAGDFVARPALVHLGPLYLLPLCLACWRLNLTIGLGVGVIAAGAVATTSLALSPHMPLGAVFANMMLHLVTLAAIAWIVAGFRYSIERERFLASRDGMTGTLNKPAFEQHAERMMVKAAAEGRPLLLAFLDLDGFKAVNDQQGHEAGDEVLKQFAAEGRAALRREDCFGRLGGDEFAVLVSLPSTEAAQETAEHLHGRFTRALAGARHTVTCSMGALIVPPFGQPSLKELMREADRLMYAAKHTGKNAVRLATCAPPLDPAATWLPLASGDGAAALRRTIRPIPTLDTREVSGGR